MNSPQRALETDGKFFFQILNSFSNYWPKSKKYSNEYRGVNIDQSAMHYISMDSSRQALQIKGKLSSNLRIIFRISYNSARVPVAELCCHGFAGSLWHWVSDFKFNASKVM